MASNGRDSYQLFAGVFDTCLVWYLLVLPSETHAVTNMTPLRAIDGNTIYNSRESFSFQNSRRVSEAQRLGLQSRHAYTITKVVEIRSPKVRGGIPLVRLRNPHGNSKEWRGDWSDE